jgi:hypothetical protein
MNILIGLILWLAFVTAILSICKVGKDADEIVEIGE